MAGPRLAFGSRCSAGEACTAARRGECGRRRCWGVDLAASSGSTRRRWPLTAAGALKVRTGHPVITHALRCSGRDCLHSHVQCRCTIKSTQTTPPCPGGRRFLRPRRCIQSRPPHLGAAASSHPPVALHCSGARAASPQCRPGPLRKTGSKRRLSRCAAAPRAGGQVAAPPL